MNWYMYCIYDTNETVTIEMQIVALDEHDVTYMNGKIVTST